MLNSARTADLQSDIEVKLLVTKLNYQDADGSEI